MVNGLFLCATLTSLKGCHIPFVQTGEEMSDTSAEAIELDTRCSWQGHSRRVGRG